MRFAAIFPCMLLVFGFGQAASPAELLYVSLGDNSIVRYDVSLSSGENIEASAQTFATTNVNNPMGIAFDASGNLFVASFNSGSILKFNASGVYQSSISAGIFSPYGLAFDSSGMLYVSNANGTSSVITKYNTSGSLVQTISGNMNNPQGLALDVSGNIYAVNTSAASITKFDPAGIYVATIGSSANLVGPRSMAFGSGGTYRVTNSSSTISIFDSSNVYQSNIAGNLNAPRGIALDQSGNFYVANFGSNSVSKFDPNGNFLLSWTTPSTARYVAFDWPLPIPEPSAYLLVTIASGILLWLWRFRRS